MPVSFWYSLAPFFSICGVRDGDHVTLFSRPGDLVFFLGTIALRYITRLCQIVLYDRLVWVYLSAPAFFQPGPLPV